MYLTLTKAQDRKVRAELVAMLKERHHRNWQPLDDDEWPLLDQPSGREALQFYRTRDAIWWANEAMTFPDRAQWHMKQYAALVKKYGTPMLEVAA